MWANHASEIVIDKASKTAPQSGGILSAWRLAKNVRNASDDELSAAVGLFGKWSSRCGWVLVLGLALEVGLAWLNFPYGSLCGRWGGVAATAVVLLGVYGEIQFSHWGTTCQGELTGRSNKQLADAKKDLERLGFDLQAASTELADATRHLKYLRVPRVAALATNETAFVTALLPFKGTEFDIGLGQDGEQSAFVEELIELLVRAEWRHGAWAFRRIGVQPIWLKRPLGQIAAASVAATNVELHIHPEWDARLRPAAAALAAALNETGVMACIPRYDCETANEGAIHILIGPKA